MAGHGEVKTDAYRTVIAKEHEEGFWQSAIAEYESQELFEYHEGDYWTEIIATCGHRHKAPDNAAIEKCHANMLDRLQTQPYPNR